MIIGLKLNLELLEDETVKAFFKSVSSEHITIINENEKSIIYKITDTPKTSDSIWSEWCELWDYLINNKEIEDKFRFTMYHEGNLKESLICHAEIYDSSLTDNTEFKIDITIDGYLIFSEILN